MRISPKLITPTLNGSAEVIATVVFKVTTMYCLLIVVKVLPFKILMNMKNLQYSNEHPDKTCVVMH